MIPVRAYEGQGVAVFGLARSGLAAALALKAGGAQVIAGDENGARCADARAAGVDVEDLRGIDWSRIAAFVPSPGVPLTHPEPHPLVTLAQNAAVPVVGDAELFHHARADLPRAKVAAVTGTNGKSTTTALLGHVLTSAGVPAMVGGNIGRGILDLDPVAEGGVYVLELSSYQIDLTHAFQADVAVLLNLTPDHLDRHGDMAGYARAKERLFTRQGEGQVAVIGVDDDHGRRFADRLRAQNGLRVVPISAAGRIAGGVAVEHGILFDLTQGPALPVGDLAQAAGLRGQHNWQNAAAAYAAARALGLTSDAIMQALLSFPGLDHRMQRVAVKDSIEFINDSKATNVDAAARALASFERIYWIAGGRPKTTDLSDLAPWFGAIRRAYLIGEAADGFAASLGADLDHVTVGDLATAVAMAYADARAAGAPAAIVLSPACASFDQFSDFEERGRVFTDIARRLAGSGGAA